jgi:hypothetical protein
MGNIELTSVGLSVVDSVRANASGDRLVTKPRSIPIVAVFLSYRLGRRSLGSGTRVVSFRSLYRPPVESRSTGRTSLSAVGCGQSTPTRSPGGTLVTSVGTELVF